MVQVQQDYTQSYRVWGLISIPYSTYHYLPWYRTYITWAISSLLGENTEHTSYKYVSILSHSGTSHPPSTHHCWVWSKKFAWQFYMWPAVGIEPQTYWFWVHQATSSHKTNEKIILSSNISMNSEDCTIYTPGICTLLYGLISSGENSLLSIQLQFPIFCSIIYMLLLGDRRQHDMRSFG